MWFAYLCWKRAEKKNNFLLFSITVAGISERKHVLMWNKMKVLTWPRAKQEIYNTKKELDTMLEMQLKVSQKEGEKGFDI